MSWIADGISGFIASILGLAVDGAAFFGAAFLGIWIAGRTRRNWVGWLAGIAALVLLAIVLAPISEALKEVQCKGANNYQDCLDDEGDYAPSE